MESKFTLDKPAATFRQSLVTAVIENCGLQAELQNPISLDPDVSTMESAGDREPVREALFIGKVFHSTVEAFQRARVDGGSPWTTVYAANAAAKLFDIQWMRQEPILETMLGKQQARAFVTSLVLDYLPHARKVQPLAVEVAGHRDFHIPGIGWIRVTTHLDCEDTVGILEYKTSNVRPGRGGVEYFPGYTDESVQLKAQPWIHMAIFGAGPYRYHVVGKGKQTLFQELEVRHTQVEVDRWVNVTLVPTLRMMYSLLEEGNLPARPSALCKVCEWRHTECGIWPKEESPW